MRIVWDPPAQPACVLVLGMFDGVHTAHQALFARGKAIATKEGLPLTVCTFEPHPLELLMPDHAPRRLTLQAERAQLIAQYGADLLAVHRFTRPLADLSPEAFMYQLIQTYHPAAMVCGYNFTYGRGGAGTDRTLTDFCASHGIQGIAVPPVLADGIPVSSTRIRQALTAGDIELATRLLGHPYAICGTLTVDKPNTLHVSARKMLPADGCYEGEITDGRAVFPAAVQVSEHSAAVRLLSKLPELSVPAVCRFTMSHRVNAPCKEA